MPAFSIGVDLGGTNLRIAAVEESGTQLEGVDALAEISRGREKVVHELTEAVRFLANKYSPSHKFLGLGIGVPGNYRPPERHRSFGFKSPRLERLSSARQP